jgi:hypothetical protein
MQANASWTTSAESPVGFGLTGGEGMSQDKVMKLGASLSMNVSN